MKMRETANDARLLSMIACSVLVLNSPLPIEKLSTPPKRTRAEPESTTVYASALSCSEDRNRPSAALKMRLMNIYSGPAL